MLIFYQQGSKEENYKCFGGELMQKLGRKKMKIGIACLAHKTDPACILAQRSAQA